MADFAWGIQCPVCHKWLAEQRPHLVPANLEIHPDEYVEPLKIADMWVPRDPRGYTIEREGKSDG